MRIVLFISIILLMSCAKNKEQKLVPTVIVQDTVRPVIEQKQIAITQETNTFLGEINKTKVRELPIFEDTNFDSFIEPEDYKDVNVKAFKLLELYPDFYKNTHNFRAIALYRVKVLEAFYTVVITIKKGDNEMESRLINYDLKGNIIDSKIVAYDEIAEGMSKIESKIEHNLITINNILWIDEKQVETKQFEIKPNGEIESLLEERSAYFEYEPKKIEGVEIDRFSIDHANQIGLFKIICGNYEQESEKRLRPNTETDWGNRLLVLNKNDEVIYQSQGVGEVYLFEPHYYQSNSSNKIIIICQLAFEYPFGGEVFIFENEKIKYLGTLNIEGNNEEEYLTDIVEIIEEKDQLQFTFKSDTLVLDPGSKDVVIKNNNIKYIYQNDRLVLKVK